MNILLATVANWTTTRAVQRSDCSQKHAIL